MRADPIRTPLAASERSQASFALDRRRRRTVSGLAAVEERMTQIRARMATFGIGAPSSTASDQGSGWSTSLQGAGSTTFSQTYARVLSAAGGSLDTSGTYVPATGSSVESGDMAVMRSPGQYGPLSVPAELRSYGNGRLPDRVLSSIGIDGHRLYRQAASSFQQMRAAAAADGVTISVTDSYRPYAEQVDLAARKGLYQDGGLAAVPGTSNHGWGMAVDMDVNDQGLAWLRANGYKYGWVESVPREPWHWEFRPANAASR